jgi:carbamoyl-phosphate synthase large subunit
MRIAVTATGGGVGQSILKALRETDYGVIALDSDRLGAGLYMVSESYIIPPASSDEYIPFLLNFCYEKDIAILFPGMDCELLKLSNSRELFTDTKIVISKSGIIMLADDKLKTQQWLKQNGFPNIPTTTQCINDFTGFSCNRNVFIKPMKGGARSKEARIIDITDHNQNLDNMVIQELIEGDEYTCGTVTLDGIYRGCIVMRRILRDGDTYKAFVERNPVIEKLCEDICTILKPEGAFNIQLRLRNGIPYVFEFNARCSGTTAARALAGFNEPLMIADHYLKNKDPEYDIQEINILRYWNELVVKELK